MNFRGRLENLERHLATPGRCAKCAERPLCFIVWPGDAIARNGGEPCGACGWAPLVIEVVYIDEPLPPLVLPGGWAWQR